MRSVSISKALQLEIGNKEERAGSSFLPASLAVIMLELGFGLGYRKDDLHPSLRRDHGNRGDVDRIAFERSVHGHFMAGVRSRFILWVENVEFLIG